MRTAFGGVLDFDAEGEVGFISLVTGVMSNLRLESDLNRTLTRRSDLDDLDHLQEVERGDHLPLLSQLAS